MNELREQVREESPHNQSKEVSCRVINSIIKYVESTGTSPAPLTEGLPFSVQYLTNPFNWVSVSLRNQLCDRVISLLKDESALYKAGLATAKLKPLGGFEQLVSLLGSPQSAYRSIPKYSRFFDKTLVFKANIVSDSKAIFTMKPKEGYSISRHSCHYTQGIFGAIPTLFGLQYADVRETHCMCQPDGSPSNQQISYGAAYCRYEITWLPRENWIRKLFGKLKIHTGSPESANELETHFLLLEDNNSELLQKNAELAKIREMALGIGSVKSVDDVYQLVVESARDIPGIRFVIAQQLHESGSHYGIPYYSRIRSTTIRNSLKSIGFDLDEVLGTDPSSQKMQWPVSKLAVAQDFVAHPRLMVKERMSELLEGLWPPMVCDAIQRIVGIKRIVLVPVPAERKQDTVLIFFLDGEIQHEVLEMVAAHCGTAINSVTLLENQEKMLIQLAESQEMLRLTLESVVEGIMVSTMDGRISQVNEALVHMHRSATREELIGQDALIIIPEEDRPKALENIQKTVVSGHGGTTEHKLVRKDGSTFDGELNTAVMRGPSGEPTGFVATVRDITERKRAEKLLKESESRLTLIAEAAADVIILLNLDYKIKYISRAEEGYTVDDLYDVPLYTFTKPDQQQDVRHHLDTVVTSRRSVNYYSDFENRDGDTLHYESIASPFFDHDEVIGIIVTSRNITERKQMESQIRHTQVLASLGQMTAGIAHEVGNPLASIMLYSEVAMKGEGVQPQTKRDLKVIHNEAKRAGKLMKDLLAYSRKLEPNIHPLDLHRVIEKVAGIFLYQLNVQNIKIDLDLYDGELNIEGDTAQLTQVFMNLIMNAGEALKGSEHGTVTVTSRVVDGQAEVSIIDDGPGIPQEYLEQIFLPFFTTKDVGEGTGLGLSTCYGIITAHTGTISGENNENGGAIFTVRLPLAA